MGAVSSVRTCMAFDTEGADEADAALGGRRVNPGKPWSGVRGQTWARVGGESVPRPSVAVPVASGQTVELR